LAEGGGVDGTVLAPDPHAHLRGDGRRVREGEDRRASRGGGARGEPQVALGGGAGGGDEAGGVADRDLLHLSAGDGAPGGRGGRDGGGGGEDPAVRRHEPTSSGCRGPTACSSRAIACSGVRTTVSGFGSMDRTSTRGARTSTTGRKRSARREVGSASSAVTRN